MRSVSEKCRAQRRRMSGQARMSLRLASARATVLIFLAPAAKASPTAKLSQIILDFSSPSHAGWSDLSRSVTEGTPIGVLVNNVGVSHAMPVPFAQSEMQENEAIVAVNVASLVRVTHMVLPGMQERCVPSPLPPFPSGPPLAAAS